MTALLPLHLRQPRPRNRQRRLTLLGEHRLHPPPVLHRAIFEAGLARREPDVAGPPERRQESPVLKALLAGQGSHGPLLAAIFLHCQNYFAVLGSSAGLTYLIANGPLPSTWTTVATGAWAQWFMLAPSVT